MSNPDRTCTWNSCDGDSVYETQCGHAFEFNDGTPADNGVMFCMYCGGKLLDISGEIESEDSDVEP